MNPRNRRLTRRAAITVTGAALGVASFSGVALAYWIATDSTYGAQAVAAVLPQGTAPTSTVTGAEVALRVPQVVTSPASGSIPVTSYTIRRYAAPTGGAPIASFTCDVTAADCREASVPDGTWYYTDAPTLGNWIGADSDRTPTVVDTTAPEVAITSPAAGALGPATPTISGTAGTAASDLPNVVVRVYAGATPTGTPLQSIPATASAGSWSVTPQPLLTGTYTAVASQGDAAGNTGTSTPITFDVDGISPAVAVDTPPARSTTKTPTLSGGYGSADGDLAAVSVQLFRGVTPVGAPLTPVLDTTAHTWSVTAPALADGTYTVKASQRDAAGNTGTAASGQFEVDTTGPAVTLTSPVEGTAVQTPTFAGAAGTANGDLSTITVAIYSGSTPTGTPVQTLTTTASGGAWSVSTSTLGSGQYTAVATQLDDLGNQGTSVTSTFFVSAAPALTLDPIGSSAGPFGGYTNTSTLTGSAGTAPGDGPVVVTINDVATGRTVTPAGGASATVSGGRWSYASGLAKDGQYSVTVSQSNNGSGTTASANFVFDASPPRLTMTTSTSGNTVTITGTAGTNAATASTSADSSVVTVVVRNAGGTVIASGPAQVGRTGSYTFSASGLVAKQQYSATVTQTDGAGNSDTESDNRIVP